MRGRALVVAILLLACIPQRVAAAGAEGASATSAAKDHDILIAEGSATIYHGDVAGARDRAVQAAMLRALQSYRGIHLEAHTVIANDELVAQQVRARTEGFVRGYELLSVSREGDVARVRVRVELDEQPAPEVLRRLQDGRTMVLVDAEGLESKAALEAVRNELAHPFPGSRVTLSTAAIGADRLLRRRHQQAPDPVLVRAVAGRARVGILVLARVATEAMASGAADIGYQVAPELTLRVAAASGTVMVLAATDGEVLATRRFVGSRGADPSDLGAAARRAIATLAQEMRSFVAESLAQHLREQETALRVIVTGTGDRLRRLLELNRWTEEVATLELGAGGAVLAVRARVPAALYVKELQGDPALEIVSFDPTAAELHLRLAR